MRSRIHQKLNFTNVDSTTPGKMFSLTLTHFKTTIASLLYASANHLRPYLSRLDL